MAKLMSRQYVNAMQCGEEDEVMTRRRNWLKAPFIGAMLVLAIIVVGLLGCGKSKHKQGQAKEPTPAEQEKIMKEMQKTVPQQQ